MFFILAGTVVVTTDDNKELCYLRDGSHFGEIALVVNIHRVNLCTFYSYLFINSKHDLRWQMLSL